MNTMDKIIYDTASIPDNMDFTKLITLYKETGLLLYDSSKGGKTPEIREGYSALPFSYNGLVMSDNTNLNEEGTI